MARRKSWTCQCEGSITDPCIVCGKPKTFVTAEWAQKMSAREGDEDPTTGSAPVGYVNRLSSPTRISPNETAELEMPVYAQSEIDRLRRELEEARGEAAMLLHALSASPAAAVTEGWQLVPKEPTEEMLDAYWHQTGESKEMRARTHAYMRRYYSAMLSASPSPVDSREMIERPKCRRCGGTGMYTQNHLATHPDEVGGMYICKECDAHAQSLRELEERLATLAAKEQQP